MNFAEDTEIHWVKRKKEVIDFVSGMIRRKQFLRSFDCCATC